MTFVVMLFNMVEIAGFFHSRLLVNRFEIVPQIGKVPNVAEVAFKVPVIDRVEAQEGGKHANVGFCEPIAA